MSIYSVRFILLCIESVVAATMVLVGFVCASTGSLGIVQLTRRAQTSYPHGLTRIFEVYTFGFHAGHGHAKLDGASCVSLMRQVMFKLRESDRGKEG
jgi:hypothetical protein